MLIADRRFFLTASLAAALFLNGSARIAYGADAEDAAPGEARIGTLIVRVAGLKSSEGSLRFVLFAAQEDFLKTPVRSEVVRIQAKQGSWTVQGLPFGEYAVLVHHDIDGSGVMERHWYGKPKEPVGASNDAPARIGPPKFKKTKFLFESPVQTLTITVR